MDGADTLFSLGAMTASVLGLAVMSSAYSGIFTRAETIGSAPGAKRRSCASKAGAPLTRSGGAMSVYSLRFLPVDTVSLSRYLDDAASSSGERNADGVAVFAVDPGAQALASRLRAADVGRGALDPFPVPCCLPAGGGKGGGAPAEPSAWAVSLENAATVVSAEPRGKGLEAWRAARQIQHSLGKQGELGGASGPPAVVVVRFSGTRATAFVQSLIASGRTLDGTDSSLAAGVTCAASIAAAARADGSADGSPGGADGSADEGPGSADGGPGGAVWACSASCPCSSDAWVPAVIFAAA